MADPVSILIVGVGGQGTILAGKVLSRAAVLSGQDVKFSEIHGMAQRGGSVVTQVRMGSKVHSPVIDAGGADYILAFEQLEALRWLHMLRSEGTIVVSSQVIEPMPVLIGSAAYPTDVIGRLRAESRVAVLDALAIAAQAGNVRTSNIVLLGRLARHLAIERTTWEQALEDTVPSRFLMVNRKAFEAGWHAGNGDGKAAT